MLITKQSQNETLISSLEQELSKKESEIKTLSLSLIKQQKKYEKISLVVKELEFELEFGKSDSKGYKKRDKDVGIQCEIEVDDIDIDSSEVIVIEKIDKSTMACYECVDKSVNCEYLLSDNFTQTEYIPLETEITSIETPIIPIPVTVTSFISLTYLPKYLQTLQKGIKIKKKSKYLNRLKEYILKFNLFDCILYWQNSSCKIKCMKVKKLEFSENTLEFTVYDDNKKITFVVLSRQDAIDLERVLREVTNTN